MSAPMCHDSSKGRQVGCEKALHLAFKDQPRRVRSSVASPAGATIESWSAGGPNGEFDHPNPGMRVVGFIAPAKAGASVKLQVLLRPEAK
jgi:hypothetical protein